MRVAERRLAQPLRLEEVSYATVRAVAQSVIACVLIDARRGVMAPDEAFMSVIDDAALSFQIVLTKADAVTSEALRVLLQSLEKTIQSHAAAHPLVQVTSAEDKSGIEPLQEELQALL